MDNRVNELRKQFGKTMKELSAETGIAYPTLSGYNQGIRTPKKKNTQILADYFGVSVPYLLGLDDNPPALNDSLEKIMVIHEVLNAPTRTRSPTSRSSKP